jgi:exodeoxyribonuclease VII small subunit
MSPDTPDAGSAADATAQEVRFSDALSELESIVRELESGQLDLEDSIARYERGVGLLAACRAKLEDAQQRVTTLMGELGPEACDDDDEHA